MIATSDAVRQRTDEIIITFFTFSCSLVAKDNVPTNGISSKGSIGIKYLP